MIETPFATEVPLLAPPGSPIAEGGEANAKGATAPGDRSNRRPLRGFAA